MTPIDRTQKYCSGILPEEYFKMYVKAHLEARAWKLIAEGREGLLTAYRLQTQPKEKCFDQIQTGKDLLDRVKKESEVKGE